MHERYIKPEIKEIWSDEHKLNLWQELELILIKARANLGRIKQKVYEEIRDILTNTPIDLAWWKNRDKIIKHDLNAFIDERIQHLPKDLQKYFHEGMTSYDTEEEPFAMMLKESLDCIFKEITNLKIILRGMAMKYRYTPMVARTHGQWAQIETFGRRCLSWYQDLETDIENLQKTMEILQYSKISGAIGNYGNIDPDLEREALTLLDFKPWYGATQIMPREMYAPIAEALCQLVETMDKIALNIRLNSRSGNVLYREPFSKKQKGSSAMPHKKNPIATEQIKGMHRMALGYLMMIMENVVTWEERAIEQSCVERVAWPDLFHVTLHSLQKISDVLSELKVYPRNMMLEIINTRGTYASDAAKNLLKQLGFPHEDAYRIVQLASFNAFPPDEDLVIKSFNEAELFLKEMAECKFTQTKSIEEIIKNGMLEYCPDLEITLSDIDKWNGALIKIFQKPHNCKLWKNIFLLETQLKHEPFVFEKVFGK